MLSRLLPAIGIVGTARPGEWRSLVQLSLAFAAIFVLVYVGADMLGAGIGTRYPVALAFEQGIPFVPQLAIVYLSIIPLLLLAPFVLNSARKLFPLVFVLALEVIVAGPVFLLFPVEEMPVTYAGGARIPLPFALADLLNLRFNYLPSLHVALSLSAAYAYSRCCAAPGKAFYFVWAAAVTASSILTHQHYVADVVAGGLLAFAGMALVYPRVSRPAFLDALQIEAICAAEFRTFARRHSRYLLIAAIIYWHSLFRWKKTRVLRVGFCLLQAIDDLLDGDRPSDVEPAQIADDLVRQLQTGRFGSDRLSLLARELVRELRALRAENDDPLGHVIALIRHMMQDRDRVRDRVLFDECQLRQHHRVTFRHSLNLLLIAAGAKARAGDVPDLIEAFAWCSVMRDLHEDLAHGLVNIPREVIEAAYAEGATLTDIGQLLETHTVRDWQRAELERVNGHLQAFAERVEDKSDRIGNSVLRIFHRSISAIAKRASRE